jgi:hypothetical protein
VKNLKKTQNIDEEREKDFTGDVEAKTPNLGKTGEAAKGKVFDEKIKVHRQESQGQILKKNLI